MSEAALNDSGLYVEPCGGGFIIADYSGRRGQAAYCGKSLAWRSQPFVRDPFPTREEAVAAALGA